MRFFVTTASGKDLEEILTEEKVAYQKVTKEAVRELGTGSYQVYAIDANLPEVTSPTEGAQGEYSTRSFRLPSGRLVVTDLEGNFEEIRVPAPSRS